MRRLSKWMVVLLIILIPIHSQQSATRIINKADTNQITMKAIKPGEIEIQDKTKVEGKTNSNVKMVRQVVVDEPVEVEEETDMEYIGEFTLTFYCGCRACNGRWYGYPSKNGEALQEGYTIAADTNVIPLNTYVYIEGFGERKVCDTGNPQYITGNVLDIYIEDHDECYKLGKIKNVKVYKIKENL